MRLRLSALSLNGVSEIFFGIDLCERDNFPTNRLRYYSATAFSRLVTRWNPEEARLK